MTLEELKNIHDGAKLIATNPATGESREFIAQVIRVAGVPTIRNSNGVAITQGAPGMHSIHLKAEGFPSAHIYSSNEPLSPRNAAVIAMLQEVR